MGRGVASAAVLPLALLALATACGGGGTETVTVTQTATVSETVTQTVTTTVTETAPAGPGPGASTVSFQMPSRNIGCLFGFRRLRCDILSGLEPTPEEACDFDWVGVDMGVTGPAAPNCGSDTVYDADAPTLEYGSTWTRGGIACESDESGLTCTNREGHEFSLARGSWSVS